MILFSVNTLFNIDGKVLIECDSLLINRLSAAALTTLPITIINSTKTSATATTTNKSIRFERH